MSYDFILEKEKSFLENIKPIFGNAITLFDIGANKGTYSKLFLDTFKNKLVTIHAFEPIPYIFEELQRNLIENKRYNTFINAAVSDNMVEQDFYYIPKLPEMSSFIDRPWYKETNQEVVKLKIQTLTLDNYCEYQQIYHIDFLKIDTEGYELNVLKGCERLLKESAIDIIQLEHGGCFLDAGITLDDVVKYINQFNYNVVDYDNGELKILDPNVNNTELFNYKYDNLYIIKRK